MEAIPGAFGACGRTDQWEAMARVVALTPAHCRECLGERLLASVERGARAAREYGVARAYGFYDALAADEDAAHAWLRDVAARGVAQKRTAAQWGALAAELPRALAALGVHLHTPGGNDAASARACLEGAVRCGHYDAARALVPRVPDADAVLLACARAALAQCATLRSPGVTAAAETLRLVGVRSPERAREEAFVRRLDEFARQGLAALAPDRVRALLARPDRVRETGALVLRAAAPRCAPADLARRVARLLGPLSTADTLALQLLAAQTALASSTASSVGPDVITACLQLASNGFVPAAPLVADVLAADRAHAVLTPPQRRTLAGFRLRCALVTLDTDAAPRALDLAQQATLCDITSGGEKNKDKDKDNKGDTLTLCCSLAAAAPAGGDIASPYALLACRAADATPADVVAATAAHLPTLHAYRRVLAFFYRALPLLSRNSSGDMLGPVSTGDGDAEEGVPKAPEAEKCGQFAAHVEALAAQQRLNEAAHGLVALLRGDAKTAGAATAVALPDDFSFARFCDTASGAYRRQLLTRLVDARRGTGADVQPLLTLAEACGIDGAQLAAEAAAAMLVDRARTTAAQDDDDDAELLAQAEATAALYATTCAPHVARLPAADAGALVLRLCRACATPVDAQVAACAPVAALPGAPASLCAHCARLARLAAARDALPTPALRRAVEVVWLRVSLGSENERQRERAAAQFAALCDDALRQSVPLRAISALAAALAWPAPPAEIAALAAALLEGALPHRGAGHHRSARHDAKETALAPLAAHILRTAYFEPSDKDKNKDDDDTEQTFAEECAARVLDVATRYVHDAAGAPAGARAAVCAAVHGAWPAGVLRARGFALTALDVELWPLVARQWPALTLDTLRAPAPTDPAAVAAFAERLLLGSSGSVAPNQALALAEALLAYQRRARAPGAYSAAWTALFRAMAALGMSGCPAAARRRAAAAGCVPLLTPADAAAVRALLPSTAHAAFDDAERAGAADAAAARTLGDSAPGCGGGRRVPSSSPSNGSSSKTSSSKRGKEDEEHEQDEHERCAALLAKRCYGELQSADPRVVAQCVRAQPGTTSAQRRATLRAAGRALAAAGCPVTAALLRAEYDRVPALLRTTAALAALNARYDENDDNEEGSTVSPAK